MAYVLVQNPQQLQRQSQETGPWTKYAQQTQAPGMAGQLPPGFVLDSPVKPNRFAKYRVKQVPIEGDPYNPAALPEGYVMGPPVKPNRFAKYGKQPNKFDTMFDDIPMVDQSGKPNRFAKYGKANTVQPDLGPQTVNIADKMDRGQTGDPSRGLQGTYSPMMASMTLNADDEILNSLSAVTDMGINAITGSGPTSFAENYAQRQAQFERDKALYERDRPVANVAGQIAGGLVTGKAGANVIAQGAGVIGKTFRGIGTGATIGGVAGFNSGDDFDSRLRNAQSGAALGGIVGGGVAPVSAAVGKVYSGVAGKLANRSLAKELVVKPRVAREISKGYADDAAMGFNGVADDSDMLLNRGNNMQLMAEEIASQPGQGRNVLIKAIEAQRQGAGQRVAATVDQTLGRDAGRVVNRNTVETERQAAGKLFVAARAHQGRFDVAPLAQHLDRMIGETDGAVRAALVKTKNLHLFKAGPGGANATQLQAARMALDDTLSKPGLGRNAARLLRDVRGQLDSTLKTNVPGWRQADEGYAAVMKRAEALDNGRDVFQRSFGSPQELAAEIRSMTPAVRADFIRGARDSVAEIMGSARNDAAAARRELLDRGWNREKLAILIGRDKATILENSLTREAARATAEQNIMGNSRTALRQNAAKAFPGGGTGTDLKGTSLTGVALHSGKWVLDKITGQRRMELSRQAGQLLSRRASEVEPILRDAIRRAGRRSNVREQIEVVSNALALSTMQSR